MRCCTQGVLAGGTLTCNNPNDALPASYDSTLCGDITTDTSISGNVLLGCQTFVKTGATLTIAPGTTIYGETIASTYDASVVTDCTAELCTAANSCIYDADNAACTPFTSVLVVEMGGMIEAPGTAAAPITFTAKATTAEMDSTGSDTTITDSTTGYTVAHGTRGNWGGLIILGNAPVKGGSLSIEGLATDVPYGGIDPTDSSGTLQYVRVWHGGAAIAADNEINGITFGGVGAGTTVDHCEVAMNVDDGFEFFGGTVNAKYLSTLYVGDDAFDTDKGYQGKMQYLLAMIGTQGNHGTEMDGNKGGQATFSSPQVMGMTIVGSNDNSRSSELMRLREGTGGAFANIVLAKGNGGSVLRHSACDEGGEDGVTVTQTPSTSGLAMLTEEYLYVAPTTVIEGASGFFTENCAANQGQFTQAVSASAAVFTAMDADATEVATAAVDPTPIGAAVDPANVEAAYSPWFDTVTYTGAFDPAASSWLDGWSYLDCVQGVLAGGTLTCTDPNASSDLPFVSCDDGTWQSGDCTATSTPPPPPAESDPAPPPPPPPAGSSAVTASAASALVAAVVAVALA